MKNYCLFHGNCRDGLTAAWVAAKILPASPENIFIPVNYGQPPPPMPDAGNVLILDFSYSRQVMKEIAASCQCLVCLDHHRTAQKELDGLQAELNQDRDRIHFDMEKSGAMLAWNYFHDSEALPIVKYAQDWDLWQFKLPFSKALSAYSKTVPLQMEEWNRFALDMEDPALLRSMALAGDACLRLIDVQIQSLLPYARMARFIPSIPAWQWNGTDQSHYRDAVAAAVLPMPVGSLISDTGAALLAKFPDVQVGATYCDTPDGRLWSLRSRQDYDCSVIAKAFGGGGHAQACGFKEKVT